MRRPRAAPGRRDHAQRGGPQHPAPRGGERVDQRVILSGPGRAETCRGQVGRRAEAQVGPVHVRGGPGRCSGELPGTAAAARPGGAASRRPWRSCRRPRPSRPRRSGAGGPASTAAPACPRPSWPARPRNGSSGPVRRSTSAAPAVRAAPTFRASMLSTAAPPARASTAVRLVTSATTTTWTATPASGAAASRTASRQEGSRSSSSVRRDDHADRGDHGVVPTPGSRPSPPALSHREQLPGPPAVHPGGEIRLGAPDPAGQVAARGHHPVHLVAARVVGDRMPPVHREQGAAWPQRRDTAVQDPVQLAAGEIVEDLGEHDEVVAGAASRRGSRRGPRSRSAAPRSARRPPGPRRRRRPRPARGRSGAASIPVRTPTEQPGRRTRPGSAVPGSSASVSAYLRAWYQRVDSPHGSGAAAYIWSKYPVSRLIGPAAPSRTS